MTETPLDEAFAAMESAPEDDVARLRFYDRLAGTELLLMLTREAEGESIEPEVFELGEGRFVLAFDGEARLSGFAGRPVPYAALSGRALAGMLAGHGIGLALNPGVDGAETLLPPEAMGWLTETLSQAPAQGEATPERFDRPGALPQGLLEALDGKLARAAGLARAAWLVSVVYEGGARGHLMAITGAVAPAQPALAGAIQEALVFSGLDAGALDVVFLDADDPVLAELERVGLRFDLPEPEVLRSDGVRPAPGSDPEKPPKLR